MKGRHAFAVVLVTALLAACQRPGYLLVGTELPELGPVVQQMIGTDTTIGRWILQPDTTSVPAGATAVRLTTTPGCNFPASGPASVPIPDSWRSGQPYLIPQALERFARREGGGDWGVVPLFFDAWGQSRTRSAAKGAAGAPDWARLVSRSPRKTVVMAGERPSFRQWVLVGAAADPAAKTPSVSGWFTQGPQEWAKELSSLRAMKKAPVWVPNAWFFTNDDLRHGLRADSPFVVLSTFRDFESWDWSGVRGFTPLQASGPSGTLLGGPVVFAEVRGGPQSWKSAAPLLRLLAGTAVQREVEARTRWLAANLQAPELDGTGAAVRYLVRRATAFAPLTDRLPDPLVEGNLFVQAQLTVDRAPGG